MTRQEIVDRVTATIGLQDIEPLDEKSLVNGWVYQGTLDLLTRTRCVARCIHLQVTSGQSDYMLGSGVLALVDVRGANHTRLRRDDTATYGFTLIRSDILQVRPTPSEDGEVDVWAVVAPQPLQADDDDLGEEAFGAIPREFQDAIELYALWHAADYSHENQTQRGERYRVLYEGQDGNGGRLRQIRQAVNKRGTAFAPRRTPAWRRSRTPRAAWVD